MARSTPTIDLYHKAVILHKNKTFCEKLENEFRCTETKLFILRGLNIWDKEGYRMVFASICEHVSTASFL